MGRYNFWLQDRCGVDLTVSFEFRISYNGVRIVFLFKKDGQGYWILQPNVLSKAYLAKLFFYKLPTNFVSIYTNIYLHV